MIISANVVAIFSSSNDDEDEAARISWEEEQAWEEYQAEQRRMNAISEITSMETWFHA